MRLTMEKVDKIAISGPILMNFFLIRLNFSRRTRKSGWKIHRNNAKWLNSKPGFLKKVTYNVGEFVCVCMEVSQLVWITFLAGGTGVSGHRGPGAKGRTLSRDIFRHQSFAFLYDCLIIFKSGLLHATSLGVVRRQSPHSEDFIGTDKKYQTSYSHWY